jgi:TPR repeat protein
VVAPRTGFRRSNRWLAGSVFLLSIAAVALGQQGPSAPSAEQSAALSGGQRGAQPIHEETLPLNNGHQYVVAIGIDHYANWPVLSTAVSDATGFAKLLTSKFGFEYAVEPLTEKNATRDAIRSLIDDDLRGRLKPEDSLVIFFAGHGTTRNDRIGDGVRPVGFIVPVGAHADADQRWSDYLNVEEMLRIISTLPASHILVILDSCHSGMALGSKFSTSRDDMRLQRDMLVKVSRKVISSAQGDQNAADRGPLPDHSLFTGLMIQGLTNGKADSYSSGFVTASQLGAYAQHEVGIAEGSRQTPLFGSFDLDEGGELIIHMGAGAGPTNADGANPANTLTKYETNELARLKKDGDRQYWRADDPLKNFPAARSATLKLCESGDAWGCEQAARSLATGLGGGTDYPRAVNLAQQACQVQMQASNACVLLGALYQTGETIEPDVQSAAHLFQQACDQGNLRGCYSVGRLYIEGHGVSKDYAQAKNFFTKACQGGETNGCNGLGSLYANGFGVTLDYKQALTWWQKACNGGTFISCGNVGDLYRNGRGVAKDPVQAISYYTKACGGGWMNGCSALGWAYQNGDGLAKDSTKAVNLYRKACDGGGTQGCVDLGLLYENGDGIAKDDAQAAATFRKACDTGGTYGCNNLGALYEQGRGVNKDLHEAQRLYNRSCEAGTMLGCRNLGWVYLNGRGVKKDVAEAARLFRQACDGGDVKACIQLASQLLSGQGVAKDAIAAVGLYRKACDSGDMYGCLGLGWTYQTGQGVAKDPSQAASLYRKVCDSAIAVGCTSLATMVYNGEGTLKDEAQAVALLHKACDAGDMNGCSRLAYAYYAGVGVPKDIAQAIALDQKACDNGGMQGCTTLAFMYATGAGVAKDAAAAANFSRKACDGGELTGCQNLAVAYYMGRGVAKDLTQAAALDHKACDSGQAFACTSLASLEFMAHHHLLRRWQARTRWRSSSARCLGVTDGVSAGRCCRSAAIFTRLIVGTGSLSQSYQRP